MFGSFGEILERHYQLMKAEYYGLCLALQLPILQISESMGNHDSKIVDADGVD